MKISVIIPAYNEAKYIVSTLEQFQPLRQHGIELVLTDDGSNDDTIQLAAGLVDIIVRLPKGQQRALGRNRNRGASAARGDILCFLDADVHIPMVESVFKRAVQAFSHQPRLVGLTLKARVTPAEERWSDRLFLGWRNISIYICCHILHIGFGSGECQLVRRQTFERVQGYHPTVATEDHDLFYRLSKQGRVDMWWSEYIEISPRRFHQDGWPHVLLLWSRVLIGWFVFRHVDKQPWVARR